MGRFDDKVVFIRGGARVDLEDPTVAQVADVSVGTHPYAVLPIDLGELAK